MTLTQFLGVFLGTAVILGGIVIILGLEFLVYQEKVRHCQYVVRQKLLEPKGGLFERVLYEALRDWRKRRPDETFVLDGRRLDVASRIFAVLLLNGLRDSPEDCKIVHQIVSRLRVKFGRVLIQLNLDSGLS